MLIEITEVETKLVIFIYILRWLNLSLAFAQKSNCFFVMLTGYVNDEKSFFIENCRMFPGEVKYKHTFNNRYSA